MARTVANPVEPPLPYAAPREEVCSDDAGSTGRGLRRTFMALNEAWAFKDVGVVNDSSPYDESAPILTNTGQVAYYRCPVLKGSGGTTSYRPRIEATKGRSSAPATASYTVRFSVGAVTLSEVFDWDGALGDTATPEWFEFAGTLDLADSGEYFDLQVEITSRDAACNESNITAIELHPERTTITELAAGEYDDGFTPQDDAAFADNEPVDTDTLRLGHDGAVVVWTRVGLLVNTAWPAGTDWETDPTVAFGTPPEGVSQVRFYFRAKEDLAASGSVTITDDDDATVTDTIYLSSTSPTWEGPLDLTVTPGVPVLFEVTGANLTAYSLVGYWRRATYA